MPLPPEHGNAGGLESIFGRAVRAARQERGWSQRELAENLSPRIKLDPTAITRIETGGRSVRLEEAVALVDALDLSLDVAARWFPDSGPVQFHAYERMAMTALLQARRELVRALRFADMALDALVGDDEDARVLAEHAAGSFPELWEGVARTVERVWPTEDPVVGDMQVITYDESDAVVKRRLVAAVLYDLLITEEDFFAHRNPQPQSEEVSGGERREED